ncbi:Sak single strand annealing protein [Neobacillus soli]|uniref:Sak single strand annealing protein n=1 Tax=Neobacillus soli TaxID=220688 RepID=UPI000826BEE3|nr:DUF1071 domain-containing protein [Neobacillus soli]
MSNEQKNYYEKLADINVNDHIEKKGKFSYLSWAWAVDTLKKNHPDATWEVIRHNGMPYIKTEVGYFVEVAVTVSGITHSQIHPVLNNFNKPIDNPTSFDINTSIQRCLVKAIALHGLGLYIFAGEDLPNSDESSTSLQLLQQKSAPAATSTQKANKNQVGKLYVVIKEFAKKKGQDPKVVEAGLKKQCNVNSFEELEQSKVSSLIDYFTKQAG